MYAAVSNHRESTQSFDRETIIQSASLPGGEFSRSSLPYESNFSRPRVSKRLLNNDDSLRNYHFLKLETPSLIRTKALLNLVTPSIQLDVPSPVKVQLKSRADQTFCSPWADEIARLSHQVAIDVSLPPPVLGPLSSFSENTTAWSCWSNEIAHLRDQVALGLPPPLPVLEPLIPSGGANVLMDVPVSTTIRSRLSYHVGIGRFNTACDGVVNLTTRKRHEGKVKSGNIKSGRSFADTSAGHGAEIMTIVPRIKNIFVRHGFFGPSKKQIDAVRTAYREAYLLASRNGKQGDVKNILVGSPSSSGSHFPKKLAARIMFEEAVAALKIYPELSIKLVTPHEKTGKELKRLID